jgi:hypothetical protein
VKNLPWVSHFPVIAHVIPGVMFLPQLAIAVLGIALTRETNRLGLDVARN